MKVVYIMGPGTARIGQTLPITNKLLTLYREGGTAITHYQVLVPDATSRDNVLVNNLDTEYVQTSFTNGNEVNQNTERARNFTNKEEITKIVPIP